MAEPIEVEENNKIPVLLAIALLVVVVFFALFLKNKAKTSTDEFLKENDTATQSVSEENTSILRSIFGEEFMVDFYAGRSLVDANIEGDVQDDSLKITHVYWQPFSVTEEARAIERRTSLPLSPGDYSMFLVETATPPDNPAILYQLGIAFAPEGYPIHPDDHPSAFEPVRKTPHSFAFFENLVPPDYPWQDLSPLDAANEFVPVDEGLLGMGYINPDSNISVLILPQEYVGVSGLSTNMTIQMFGRDIANPENFGVSGISCSLDSVPDPLSSPIFADGFESGDTSAWSNSFCN